MGHSSLTGHGSDGSWVTKYDPLSALFFTMTQARDHVSNCGSGTTQYLGTFSLDLWKSQRSFWSWESCPDLWSAWSAMALSVVRIISYLLFCSIRR